MVTTSHSVSAEVKQLLHLSIPLVSALLAYAATGFVDTIMMGHLGRETLAAGGLAALTFQVLMGIANSIVMGISPLIAEAHGANQTARIEQIARQGLWLGLLLTVPLMIMIGHLDAILQSLGQSPQLVTLAQTYLNIMVWGVVPAIAFAVLRGVVSGLSHPQPVMAIVIGGTVLNIVGNYPSFITLFKVK